MKKKSPVEANIVATALTMFNEAGIEYVGMRELAKALEMRVGNLTYYFPTKDDLVNRLTLDLSEENDRTIVSLGDMDMRAFFEMLREVFENHLKYRCLMLSFVHIMERNPLIAKRYSKTQNSRNETWVKNIEALREGKHIVANAKEVRYLVSTISLIARFWISEASISFKNVAQEDQVNHYLGLIARIFLPYSTKKSKMVLTRMVRISNL